MPGVGDDQLAVVEHVVADQPVEEVGDLARGTPAVSRSSCCERLGQPVRDLHVAAAQLPQQLHVVVAGHAQRGARRRPCPSTSRSTSGDVAGRGRPGRRGRRALRPAGCATRGAPSPRVDLVAERRRAARRSSSQQPWTSPMMSNGPCSSRRSFHSGSRSIVGRLDLLGRARARRRGGSPRAAARAATAAAAASGCGRRAGRSRGRAGRRLRSWQSRSGRSSTIATGRHVVLAGQRDQRLARLGLHVGGVDDRQPPGASRLPAMKCSTSKASFVAAWSFSSSETSAAAGVGREDLGRQEVRRARTSTCRSRDAPIRTTSESSGIVSAARRHRASNTAICVGAPSSGVLRADGREAHRVAVALRRRRSAQAWNSARVHSKRWSRCRNCPAGSVSNRTLYSRFGVVSDDRRRPRVLEQRRARTPPAAAGRGARSPRPRRRRRSPRAARRGTSSEPCSSWMRSRCRVAAAGRARSRSRGDLERADATRRRRRSRVELRAPSSSALQQLALAAAEVEHAPARRSRCSTATTAPSRCSFRLSGASTASSSAVARGLASSSGSAPRRREQLRQRLARQARPVLEVAAGDQLALRMRGEPALAVAQQLLDLVVADPVVLVVVEHRDEHVEVREQVARARTVAVERHGEVRGSRPTPGTRSSSGWRSARDRVAERLEQPPQQRLAAAARQRRRARASSGSGVAGQLGPVACSARPAPCRTPARSRRSGTTTRRTAGR